MRLYYLLFMCTFCACSTFTYLHRNNDTVFSSKSLFIEINKVREYNNLKPLKKNQELEEVALEYSKYMAEQEFFAHKDPKNRRLNRRLSQSGIKYLLAAENLAWIRNGNLVTIDVVEAWLDSENHKVNVLDEKFTETGIGVANNSKGDYYVTQIFIQLPRK